MKAQRTKRIQKVCSISLIDVFSDQKNRNLKRGASSTLAIGEVGMEQNRIGRQAFEQVELPPWRCGSDQLRMCRARCVVTKEYLVLVGDVFVLWLLGTTKPHVCVQVVQR